MAVFYDRATIQVKAGKGGDGMVAFRREKYVPDGGPAGGDGGKGGSVIFKVDSGLRTLLDFRHKRHFKAKPGENGMSKSMYGRGAEDLIVKVPPGTIVRNAETKALIADLVEDGQEVVVAKGGRGGRGNIRFATHKNPAPDIAENGEPGEEFELDLELKVLADVGLVGFPSVGKSTLLSVISSAKPKIANYHFTTLKPNLGVVKAEGINSFVMADIPGIIEGAAEGVGLGIQFLRHIERTRLLIHVVDISGVEGREPFEDFVKINEELKKYSVKLWDRPQIVVANKCDMLYDESVYENFKKAVQEMGYNKVFKMSAATSQGIEAVMQEASKLLKEIPLTDLEIADDERFIPEEKRFTYTINEVEEDGLKVFVVEGTFVDRLLLAVNVNEPDSLRYFHKVLKNKGIFDELREMGIEDGDVVRVNDFEFEYML